MKGAVTMKLNQETVMQAVQDYLDKHITPKMKLTGFVADNTSSNYSSGPGSYTAALEEIKEPTSA